MMTHIIYIPGLGDSYDGFRRAALRLWSLQGVTTEYVPITWFDGKDFNEKMGRVDAAIKRAKGKRIVLIGESAGATLALHASNNSSVTRVITLCGVARPDTPISQYLRRRAPALDQAVRALPEKYDVDVHSIRAIIDTVVNKRWSKTNDATIHVFWTIGHRMTIILCLTILSPFMVMLAKK